MHKTANVQHYFPKSMKAKVKADVHEIWQSATKKNAEKAFDLFVEKYGAKYPKAVACLETTFLDTRAAAVVDANHRRAILHRHILNFADLLRMGFRQRSAKDSEILAEHIDHSTIDGAPTGDNAIARGALLLHAELGAAVRHEHIELFKAALIQQQLYAFTRCQLPLGMLGINALLPTAKACRRAPRLQFLQNIFHGEPPILRAQHTPARDKSKDQSRKFANILHQSSCNMQICKS